jgi:hypothetical protein
VFSSVSGGLQLFAECLAGLEKSSAESSRKQELERLEKEERDFEEMVVRKREQFRQRRERLEREESQSEMVRSQMSQLMDIAKAMGVTLPQKKGESTSKSSSLESSDENTVKQSDANSGSEIRVKSESLSGTDLTDDQRSDWADRSSTDPAMVLELPVITDYGTFGGKHFPPLPSSLRQEVFAKLAIGVDSENSDKTSVTEGEPMDEDKSKNEEKQSPESKD